MPVVDLTAIERFVLQQEAAHVVEAALAYGREYRCEALALVAGRLERPGRFLLDTVFVPRQRATIVSVRLVEGSLIPIHQQLAELQRTIALQVHSHPTDAFHSDTDDADDTVTQEGSLSLVVPWFGAKGLDGFPECVLHRRTADGWSPPIEGEDLHDLLELAP